MYTMYTIQTNHTIHTVADILRLGRPRLILNEKESWPNRRFVVKERSEKGIFFEFAGQWEAEKPQIGSDAGGLESEFLIAQPQPSGQSTKKRTVYLECA